MSFRESTLHGKPRKYDASGRAAQADASRRQILDAARALFARRGIDRVTVAEIAHEAEVGVYAAFESKGGILRALMAETTLEPRYRDALARLDSVTDVVEKVVRSAEVSCAVNGAEDDVLGLARGASAFSPQLRQTEPAVESLRYRMQGERVREPQAAGMLAPGLSLEIVISEELARLCFAGEDSSESAPCRVWGMFSVHSSIPHSSPRNTCANDSPVDGTLSPIRLPERFLLGALDLAGLSLDARPPAQPPARRLPIRLHRSRSRP